MNTFILMGYICSIFSFLFLNIKKHNVSFYIGILSSIIGLTILSQVLFNFTFNLVDVLWVGKLFQNNLCYLYAITITLFGFTAIVLSIPKYSRKFSYILFSIGTLILSFGITRLIAYLFEIPLLLFDDVKISFVASIFNSVIGIGIIVSVRNHFEEKLIKSDKLRLIIIGIFGFVMSVTIWQALLGEQMLQNKKIIETDLVQIKNVFESEFKSSISALSRMVKRWQVQHRIPKSIWQQDANLYIENYSYLSAIQLFDPDYILLGEVLSDKHIYKVNENPFLKEKRDSLFQEAKQTKTIQMLSGKFLQNEKLGLQVILPVFIDNNFDGVLIATFSLDELFKQIFERYYFYNYSNEVYHNDNKIFSNISNPVKNESALLHSINANILNEEFLLLTSKLPNRYFFNESLLPEFVFLNGISITIILVFLFYHSYKRKLQTKELSKVNQYLNNEIKKRKEAEEKIKHAHNKIEDLVNTVNGIVWEADAKNFRFTFVSEQAHRILGYPTERWINEPKFWQNHIHPDDREWVVSFCSRATEEKKSHQFEYRMIAADGNVIWLNDIVVVVLKDGEPEVLRGIMVDLTERKQAEEMLTKLSISVEQAADSIIITDLNGVIEYANKSFFELTGYSKEEVLGKTPRIVKSGKHNKKYYKKLWDTILSGKTFKGVLINKKKNGELYYSQSTIIPMKDKRGKIINFVNTSKDITTQIKAEEKLKAAKEKAEELNRLKTNFMANMSHELRTPLVGILGFAELIKNESTDSEAKEFAEYIFDSGNRLIKTLSSILDFSKIENNKLKPIFEKVELCTLISKEFMLFTKQAEEKNLDYKLNLKVKSIKLKSDGRLLRAIVNHLIDNAIKYTVKGFVEVEIDKTKDDLAEYCLIKVKDSGIGIKKDSLDIIFEEFRQESEGTNRKYEGSGLGLSIVRKFVALLKGKIEVESKPGKGSCFIIRIPIKLSKSKKKKGDIIK